MTVMKEIISHYTDVVWRCANNCISTLLLFHVVSLCDHVYKPFFTQLSSILDLVFNKISAETHIAFCPSDLIAVWVCKMHV